MEDLERLNNINKMLDTMVSLMAKSGDKEAVFVEQHNRLFNMTQVIYANFMEHKEKGGMEQAKLERYIEFYKQINVLVDEFMKGEKIGC